MQTPVIPYAATGISGVGLEGTTFVTAENFTVQTGFLAGYEPARLISPAFTAAGHFQFVIEGVTPGATNVVETSTDLTNWTTLSTNVPLNTQVPIDDATAASFTQRFYRSFEAH